MIKISRLARWPRKSFLLILALALGASSLGAQGIMDVIIPNSGGNPDAIYRAKVRDSVTSVLQKWARSLEQRDTAATASAYVPNAKSIVGDQGEATNAIDIARQLYKTPLAGVYLDLSIKDFDMSGDLAFVSAIMIVPNEAAGSAPTYVPALFVFRFDAWHNRWQVRQQLIELRPNVSLQSRGGVE
jgi:ketosteroid isomerase-like protein